MNISIAVIGAGYWGTNLIREFYKTKYLTTICDVSLDIRTQMKQKYPDVNVTDSFESVLLNPSTTSIVIALPAKLHYEFALKALNANKHVFLEKPMTLNVSEAEHLCQVATSKNLTLMIGHLLQYHEGINVIKSVIEEGTIGDIKHIHFSRQSHGIYRQDENVLWSFAPHDISLAASFTGLTLENFNSSLKSIQCSGTKVVTNSYDIVNTTMTVNNINISMIHSWINPSKEQKITVTGSEGFVTFDDVTKVIVVKPKHSTVNSEHPIADKSSNTTIYSTSSVQRTPLENECLEFIKCCTEQVQSKTDCYEGLLVLKVLNKCSEILEKKSDNDYFIHETSVLDPGALIGTGTKIWHWCHVTNTASIGSDSSIGQSCYIAGILGSNCKVQNNVNVYQGVTCGSNVFLGPNCTFTNVKFPRASYKSEYIETIIESNVTVGANVTIGPGITIGENSFISAGCTVYESVPPNTVIKPCKHYTSEPLVSKDHK